MTRRSHHNCCCPHPLHSSLPAPTPASIVVVVGSVDWHYYSWQDESLNREVIHSLLHRRRMYLHDGGECCCDCDDHLGVVVEGVMMMTQQMVLLPMMMIRLHCYRHRCYLYGYHVMMNDRHSPPPSIAAAVGAAAAAPPLVSEAALMNTTSYHQMRQLIAAVLLS